MRNTGPGTFYDGRSARPIEVTLTLGDTSVRVENAAGTVLAHWPREEVRMADAPPGVLRMRLADDDGARLEVSEPGLAEALVVGCSHLNDNPRLERSMRRKVVLWSLAACVSLILLAVYGVPAIAERLVPVIPHAVDRQIGAGVKQSLIRQFSKGEECAPSKEAEAAFRALSDRLVTAAGDLPGPVEIRIVPSPLANAFALPGGSVILLDGLIKRSKTPDEVAGVIAHELGHVANRHVMRKLVSEAGLYFLLGLVLGDFSGGTVIIAGSRAVLSAGYSREAEREADDYAVALMRRAGGDPAALASLLERIASGRPPGALNLLSTHPYTPERAADIRDAAASDESVTLQPLLDATQWRALKSYCGAT